MNRVRWIAPSLTLALAATLSLAPTSLLADEPPAQNAADRVDARTLRHKVLCGYQGWFRCPGDARNRGWLHWGRDAQRLTPESLTVEMWPDVREYPTTYPVPGWTLPDGSPAKLFSSVDADTVQLHFQWMKQYGIDGVFVQRFLVNLPDTSFDQVLRNARRAAADHQRVFGIGYDLTAADPATLVATLEADWQRLVDQWRLTADEPYLHHNGKPVVFVWGFFDDRFEAAVAHRVLDVFQSDERYQATVIGGVPWWWRRVDDAEWARAFRRMDVVSPWNVGNVTHTQGEKHATTSTWAEDLATCREHKQHFLPVIYPGFGWKNLKGPDAETDEIPRLGGRFFWRQFTTAADLGVEMAYVAMFDEVDEATAIFKVSNTPPQQASFLTLDDDPTDWYLRLTGEGTRVIRGERPADAQLPDKRREAAPGPKREP